MPSTISNNNPLVGNSNSNRSNNAEKRVLRDFAAERQAAREHLTAEQNAKQAANRHAVGIEKSDNEKVFESLGIGMKEDPIAKEKNSASEIGDFMTLFLTQLKCQNPLDPTEGSDFVAQLAQFNSVEQLQKVNKGIQNIADSFRSNRILAATSMIGKHMNVPTNKMLLASTTENGETTTEVISGVIKVPMLQKGENIIECRMKVSNDKGEVVENRQLAVPLPGRDLAFTWSGADKDGRRLMDNSGQQILDGNYTVKAEILVSGKSGGEWMPLKTVIATKVNSVSLNDAGEIEFSAAGIGTVSLDELKEISSVDELPNLKPKILAPNLAEAGANSPSIVPANIAEQLLQAQALRVDRLSGDGNS